MSVQVSASFAMVVGALTAVGCSESATPRGADGGAMGDADAIHGGANASGAAPMYPYVAGSTWTYRHRNGAEVWTEDVTLETIEFEGRDLMELSDTPGPGGSRTRSILEQSGTEVRRIHKEVTGGMADFVADYAPGFTRFDELWTMLPMDTVDERTYERTEVSRLGGTTVQPRVQRYTIEEHDVAVMVPAGTFTECTALVRSRRGADGGPPAMGEERDKRFWFCPGVGKVKEENLTDGGTEVLLSCFVPGGNCPEP